MKHKKYWFKRGFGRILLPTTWQGWLTIVLLIFIPIIVWDAYIFHKEVTNKHVVAFSIMVVVQVTLVSLIMRFKGPKPRWRWVRKDTDNSDEDF